MGRVIATWPLGLLWASEGGIDVSISLTPSRWQAAWTDIEKAQWARGSVLLIGRDGSKAKFIAGTKGLQRLRDELEAHGVALEQAHRVSWRTV